MNDNEARKLLDETFNTEFNPGKFSNFLKELFNGFYPQDRFISPHSEYAEKIVSIKKIGNYKQNNKSMEILIVQLKKGISLDRARTMQRNVVAKLLKNFNIDSALVAFISEDSLDWRFSFIKMDYKLMEDGKVSEELTPAKRYSFLVGPNEPNHTCRSQFVDLVKTEIQKPSIDEIENAFSIEKVTKEFFEKYKNLYHHLKDGLDYLIKKDKNIKEEFEDKQISTVDFAKKLLGQIVFLYFLQKKGWLGIKKGEKGKFEQWGKGSRRFIQELFYKAQQEKKNFFNDYLEPLFYHALATDRRADGDYYEKFNCKVPFLNGGLFEPLNGYNWGETDINLNNDLFEEIFMTFDEFNFTIKEDEPLEKEVAVDPEMLGKVFENLLDVQDRKSKGAFYTPREIVHYMCQQSLINYLETNIDIPKKDLDFFVQKGDLALEYLKRQEIGRLKSSEKEFVLPKTISQNAKELDRLLTEIKICDPAVGSGAFPVGMMNEIIKARTILSYLLKKPKTDYELKRETIENSLYGVDIEPSAVEITKLRFWLSLIVDEEGMNNIKPLPNLENKIMCGNSLIEEFEGIKLYIDPQEIKAKKDKQVTLDQSIDKKIKKSEQKLKELRKKQKEFFDVENRTQKNILKKEIDKIEWEFIEETLREQGDGENMKKLEQYKKNKSKPFFLWKLYFSDVFHRDNPGFDVVIANPPYVKEYTNKGAFDGLKNSPYYQGKMDLWYFFGCMGIDLLKEGGVECFIAPNNWRTNFGASILRKNIIERTKILEFIDFGDYKVFTAGIQTMVYILKKDLNEIEYPMIYSRLNNPKIDTNQLVQFLYAQKGNYFYEKYDVLINRDSLAGGKTFSFLRKNIQIIIKKILAVGNFYLQNEDLAQGIVAPQENLNKSNAEKLSNKYKIGTGIFVLTENELKDLKLSKGEMELIKPYYTSENISKYWFNNKNKFWIIYTKSDIKQKIKKYPTIKAHLDNFKEIITSDNKPYGLHRARNEDFFNGEKIISIRKCKEPSFSYTDYDTYLSQTFYIIKTKKISLKFLISLLNSKLISFWLYYKGKIQGDLYQIDSEPLKEIPIKKIPLIKQKPLIEIVDKILDITKDEDYLKNPEKQAKVKAYEKQIDRLVYALYGLTEEEIKIVEGFGK